MEVWIRALPYRDLNVNSNSVICVKHCPENYPTVKLRGKERLHNRPSVWPLARYESCIPTLAAAPPPRPTQRKSFTVRSMQPWKMDEFLKLDKVNYDMLTNRILKENYNFVCPTVFSTNEKKYTFNQPNHIWCASVSPLH